MKSLKVLLPLIAIAFAPAAAAPALAAPVLEPSLDNDVNEIQEVFVSATAGQFRLGFGEGGAGVGETAEIAVGASEGEVQAALNALANVAAGGGSVSVKREGGAGALRYYVHFDGGPLAHTDVPRLSAPESGVPPSGGASTPAVQISTLQNAVIRRGDERVDYTAAVSNAGPDPTSGAVTLEVRLPAGPGSSVFEAGGSGWACEAKPANVLTAARAICTRSSPLAPGASSPPLTVAAALGADAPDPAVATAVVSGGGAPQASAASQFHFAAALSFGIRSFDASVLDRAGEEYVAAGGHPYIAKANFALSKKRALNRFNLQEAARYLPVGYDKHVVVDVPRGFTGNVQALADLCPSVERVIEGTCPRGSAVGGISVIFSGTNVKNLAIFAIEPERGLPAQFAFASASKQVYTFAPHLRAEDNYAIRFESAPNFESAPFLVATPELCSFGAKSELGGFKGCKTEAEALAEDPGAKPLITNPTRCDARPETTLRVDSWQEPGRIEPDGSPDLSDPRWKSSTFPNAPIAECGNVPFEPRARIAPTSREADSATGLEVDLEMPTEGLEGRNAEGEPDPGAVSQSHVRSVRVSFPEGMAVNPSAGQGLGACDEDQIKLGTNEPVSCPEASKIGTVEIETPILARTLKGSVYVARQGDVEGALVGFYLVFDSPEDGLLIKIPSRVDFVSPSGRLVATVAESPEAPFSAARLRFPQGPRSPLLNPPRCGRYEIEAELTPWSGGAPVTQRTGFEVDRGPGGGGCPGGGLEATLVAGAHNPLAAQTTPFSIRLSRPDGSDRFKALGLKLPRGLTAYLKGVPYCPEATLAAIPTAPGTGRGEIESPSCPAAAQIGRVSVGAGAGANPLYVDTARAYLAPPYKGAPLSIAVVAPAVAGPLDLGNVVVRNAIHLDPKTAEVDAVSDPIPHILHGLLLDVRDVRILIDRPAFTLNPTDCSEKQVAATVAGLGGASAPLANRFQVGGCESLGFKPTVKLRLFGGTRRGDYQGVRAVVRPRPGDANISRAVVRFPRSAFVAQEHIRTVCTRVQFAADACPKGSIYGKAVAWSPLLDYPLRGNVYLRSSDNLLPDAVADLRGPAHQPVRFEVAVRNDSVKGALRNTVQAAPDAPVSYFRLQTFGGRKGLIVNSRDICATENRAAVAMRAHNGRRALLRPRVLNKGCAARAKAQRKRKAARKRAAGRGAGGRQR